MPASTGSLPLARPSCPAAPSGSPATRPSRRAKELGCVPRGPRKAFARLARPAQLDPYREPLPCGARDRAAHPARVNLHPARPGHGAGHRRSALPNRGRLRQTTKHRRRHSRPRRQPQPPPPCPASVAARRQLAAPAARRWGDDRAGVAVHWHAGREGRISCSIRHSTAT